ncbi:MULTISPECIES: cytochrome b [Ensifer]|uniref:Cytochrome b n=1 Tax=Ensifer canadensis TaxID=555315 RepID=A0AAW4FEF4_9HYPH|nr:MULTISPECIES: cytochrome b [Ensifer]MDP9629874.1 cytochrome b561 [Ensifer adhaerens]KQU97033.1 cytochrome B [Ensifer sp. Root31]KQW49886.1 cytochrome B [Ensifer sp. Root1252]KQW75550.1 cytochrome B [Ensifer sp. Root127]KQY67183.1 cytochrome B [Ensifer sp. Root142]
MLQNSKSTFGWVTIILHWLIAMSILGLLALGFVMRRLSLDPALQFSLYQWHKSFGFTVLALAALRAVWHVLDRQPQAPSGLSVLERRAARTTHAILIGLTIAVPLAGWAVASTSTLNIPSFYFDWFVISHLPMAKSEAAESFWTSTHAILAYATLALVALHAMAALYHHMVRRDEVLVRMLPTRLLRRGEVEKTKGSQVIAKRK